MKTLLQVAGLHCEGLGATHTDCIQLWAIRGTLAWDIHSPFLQSKAAHLRASAALLEWFGVGPYCEVVPC